MNKFDQQQSGGNSPSPSRPPSQLSAPAATGDAVLQSEVLESLSAAVEYQRWLTELALPYLGDHPLELGSGLGQYAQTWLGQGVPAITTTEIEPSRLAYLRRRFAADPRVHVASLDIRQPPAADYSSLVAFNVLEHIDDHVGALRAAHRLVRPGGAVVMFVPAFQFAQSRFDRHVGHFRRYTAASMRTAMVEAGLIVERSDYVNIPGLAAWFVGMKVLRMTPRDSYLLRLWDRHVIPKARWWEQRHRAPFGQSVFAVARVPPA